MAKTIGRYEIREELGRGGMAAVYLAFDSRLDRQVALKLMDQQLSEDPAFAARFEREAKTVASLHHNAVVSLYDFGEADGWLYLVMPYMRGGTLKALIANGPLTTRQAYNVIRRMGSALDKAHGQNIIHRDLKPANILLDEEQEPYLSDFGIVKVAQGDTEYLTDTGQTMGTYAYMSPEQIMGQPIDGRSDIYALGIVLYEMLTGKHPYGEATTTGAMAVAHTQQPVPDVTAGNPALPAALNDIIRKAMAKDPGERYGSGREMALALYETLAGKPAPAAVGPAAVAAATATAAEPLTKAPGSVSTAEPGAKEAAKQPPPVEKPAAASAARGWRQTPVWIFILIGVVAIACIGLFTMALLSAIGDATAEEGEIEAEATRLAEEIFGRNENVEDPTKEPIDPTPTPVFGDVSPLDLSGETVTILTGADDRLVSLLEDSLSTFEKQSGVDIVVERVDDLESVAMTRIAAGDPPDIYHMLMPSLMTELAHNGQLVDLNHFLDSDFLHEQFHPSFLDMGTVDGQLVGLWRDANLWSHVWYSKKTFDELGLTPPQTWDDLLNLSEFLAAEGITPWCLGIESGDFSGWPGTFWVEEILLRTAGPEARDQWVAGGLPFSSPEVRQAFDMMGMIWLQPEYIHGGTEAINKTFFGDAPAPMFDSPAGCVLNYNSELITNFFPAKTEFGVDVEYFYLPPVDEKSTGRPVLITGSTVGLAKDTPAGRAVMQYLATGESIRAEVQAGDVVAPHTDVPLEWYPDDVKRGYAEMLRNASVIRSNGSDLMPAPVGAEGSFRAGIVDYVNGADLDTVLKNIDASWP